MRHEVRAGSNLCVSKKMHWRAIGTVLLTASRWSKTWLPSIVHTSFIESLYFFKKNEQTKGLMYYIFNYYVFRGRTGKKNRAKSIKHSLQRNGLVNVKRFKQSQKRSVLLKCNDICRQSVVLDPEPARRKDQQSLRKSTSTTNKVTQRYVVHVHVATCDV